MRLLILFAALLFAAVSQAAERPLIVIVGSNEHTEISDFMLPYGVLKRADVADVLTASVHEGPIRMSAGPRVQPDASLAEFDRKYPAGANYVIVPAMHDFKDPTLADWLKTQAAHGATLISICDGALVLANAGVLKGHQATAHWATRGYREEHYPDTTWLANARYVADGKVITSVGISAAIPTSLALVETIAGSERARAVANDIGVSGWGTEHDSTVFGPHLGNLTVWMTWYTDPWFHSQREIGVPVAQGVDEIALAITADAYQRAKRAVPVTVAASDEPLHTLYGLTILPERVAGTADAPVQMLPALDSTPPALMWSKVLGRIADDYGSRTAQRLALEFEYPDYAPR
ncbi:DJ-1/PfpI family protein [Pseudoduganella sp. RAF19]|uniref:DJ-1/PfpI family protein n=1 Tax=Pseudoduganella sp. RAF19 TaxID=3233052 RepID=UPI003F9DFA47